MPVLSAPQELVREAQRLRDRGEFAAALQLLDKRLEQSPDDAEAARLRAQTLYWMKDVERARAGYATAVGRHPGNTRLRLDFARMLAETGNRSAARALLEPLRRDSSASAEADALLGTLAYWDGDYTGARRLFLSALRADPAQHEAARQLREIQLISAPWLRVSPSLWHDDQSLDRSAVALEAGWFVSPLLSLTVRSHPARYSAGASRTFWSNEVEISHFAPAAHLETSAAAGAFRRPGDPTSVDWTGRLAVGLRAGAGVTLRGRVERAPYLHTVASLQIPVMADTALGLVHWNHSRGWIGEAALQRQQFPDGNIVRTRYGWLLAPLVHGAHSQLQAGYAVAGANADEDRFTFAQPQQPFPPADPRFSLAGVYTPYYTPARVFTQSAIAAITAGKRTGPVLRADGSYGFRAAEDATVFEVVGDQVVAAIHRRHYSPWTVRAALEIPATPALSWNVSGEAGRTAFYRWTTARLQITYRFLPEERTGESGR